MKGDRNFSRGAILVSAILWGTSFPVIKIGLYHVNAFHFAFIRFLIASGLLLALLRIRGTVIPRGLWTNRFVLVLAASNAAGFFLQFAGMTRTGAMETSLLVNSNFVLVILLSTRLFGERIRTRGVVVLIISEVGVILLTTGGDTGFIHSSNFFGNLLVFLAGLAWVVYILANKLMVSHGNHRHGNHAHGNYGTTSGKSAEITTMPNAVPKGEELDNMVLITVVMCLTALFLLPAALLQEDRSVDYGLVGWSTVFYVSVFCTAIPFLLYSHGLREVSAGASCIMLLLEIVVAGIISAIFLSEALSGIRILGAILIMLGMVSVTVTTGQQDNSVKSKMI